VRKVSLEMTVRMDHQAIQGYQVKLDHLAKKDYWVLLGNRYINLLFKSAFKKNLKDLIKYYCDILGSRGFNRPAR
jgi:hypothetical protein